MVIKDRSALKDSCLGSRPSIAIVSYYFTPLYGGLETQLLMLSKFLAAEGSDVTVFTSRLECTESDEYMFDFRIRRFGAAESLEGIEQAYTAFLRELEDNIDTFDILYMPLGISLKYPLSLQLKVAQLFFSHQKPVVLRITSSGRVQELLRLNPKSIYILQQASKVISLNKGITSELKMAGVYEEAIFIIPNGVDVNLFRPVYSDDDHKLERDYPIKFVYPCRICEKKNIDTLIADWMKAQDIEGNFKNAELLIIGDDNSSTEDRNFYKQIKKMVDFSDANVRLLPAIDYRGMPNLYRMSDIFICYSIQEGMSNATLEAMASGLPIIAPDTDAFRSLLHSSPNFLFKNSSDRINVLLEAARKQKDWKRIGLFNRNRVIENFSTDIVLPKYLNMFASLDSIYKKNSTAI